MKARIIIVTVLSVLISIPMAHATSRSLLRDAFGATFEACHNVQTIAPLTMLSSDKLVELRREGQVSNNPQRVTYQTTHFLKTVDRLPVLVLPRPVDDPYSRILLRSLRDHLSVYYSGPLLEQLKTVSRQILRAEKNEKDCPPMAEILLSIYKYGGPRMLVLSRDFNSHLWIESAKRVIEQERLPSNIMFVKVDALSADRLNIIARARSDPTLCPRLLYFYRGSLLGSQTYTPSWEEPINLPKDELFIPYEMRRFYRHGSISPHLPVLKHSFKVERTGYVDSFGQPFGIYSGSEFEGQLGKGYVFQEVIGGDPNKPVYRVMFEQIGGSFSTHYHDRIVERQVDKKS